ncbi:PREDICTED: uncharacterized protein LOC109355025 isoform X2 [Lupinus angustifolius]|uniref:uncharacterized protein LOC109355025 isoform X2 n=1 Tax=Lupinus angustifolius TaxID=3871 RepID=UPI00092FB739|nr:PREDICTED: uncharacterized protein LOC109355025 isoform X2 [Lupinus angustifolius]
MAVSAFKSSSRRSNQSSAPSSTRPSQPLNKPPIRRSRSVSAFSRSNLDISNEFLNKRDNPLFDETSPNSDPKGPVSADSNNNRGRSVTRNGESRSSAAVGRKESGRVLSGVDSGRRTRSASQCPVPRRRWSYSTSESEAECKDENDLKLVGNNRKGGLFGSDTVIDQVKELQHSWSSHHSPIKVSDCFATTLSGLQTQNCDDAVSTASSGYRSDERTIKAVCEQSVQEDLPEASDIYETVRSEVRRAISDIQNDLASSIQRSNPTAIAVTNVADIPPDLVNPGAVELVLEIRREYAKKLEESQERARNLREGLAVEEHRGQELDRILKEVLPYPMTPSVPKSRPARKASIERRRMSKRLAEDAKAYFDECVSLSTFDSSDFSSQEDPPLKSVGPPIPSSSYVCSPEASSNASVSNFISFSSFLADKQESSIQEQSRNMHYDHSQPSSIIDTVGAVHGQLTSITGSIGAATKPCFSFSEKPSETSGLQQYVKKFEKNVSKLPTTRPNFRDCEYHYQSSAESVLVDRVLLRNRIDSGSLLLCCAGNMLTSKFCGMGI